MLCELIDTLWNVNNSLCSSYVLTVTELIDTLWNVNVPPKPEPEEPEPRINRYIMECKCMLVV